MHRIKIRGMFAAMITAAAMAALCLAALPAFAFNGAGPARAAAVAPPLWLPTGQPTGRTVMLPGRAIFYREHRRAWPRHGWLAVASRGGFLAALPPQVIAESLVAQHGWDSFEWSCLDTLWTRESDWEVQAADPSGAYGIPQALPAWKMASYGANWQTDALTQIEWGLAYIAQVYGTPCYALVHSEDYGFY
jgi:hypothetical protein